MIHKVGFSELRLGNPGAALPYERCLRLSAYPAVLRDILWEARTVNANFSVGF